MLKTYLLLFGIVAQVLIGWNGNTPVQDKPVTYQSRPVAVNSELPEKAPVEETEVDYSKKIADLGITLHPGTDFTADSTSNPISENRCASLVYRTLQAVPEEVSAYVDNLTLYFNSTGRRGLGGGSTIILRCQNVTDAELVSVFVHELGHVQDTGVLTGNFWAGESEFRDGKNAIYNDDVSLEFYRIGFKNEKTIRSDVSDLDFVSGYAKTDPFEDFSETYNYYLLHGDAFRILAGNNDALMKKYEFMREKVFHGREYNFDGEVDSGLLLSRNYDSTVIGYKLEEFLAI